jgi:GxxExxY protein
LESGYDVVLARDLVRPGLCVERRKPFTFQCEGTVLEDNFRADIIVNNVLIGEVKAPGRSIRCSRASCLRI